MTPFKLHAQKGRAVIKSEECLTPRVIYSTEWILKKHQKCFLFGLSKIEYYCGERLFPADFADTDAKFVEQKTFFKRFIVCPNITCADGVKKKYYTLKNSLPICYKCNCDLSSRADIINLIDQKKQESTVLPTCQSVKCGRFICQRKKQARRLPQGVQAQPAKRRKKDQKNNRGGRSALSCQDCC